MKVLKIVYVIVVFILTVALIILSTLGSKERTGYFSEFKLNKRLSTSSNEYVYHARMKYYDKTFRNNDIYGVYPRTDNLPEYIKSVEWDSPGSPFGFFTSSKELSFDDKIDNVSYILKVKKMLIFYLIFLIIALPILYTAFKKSNIEAFYKTNEVEELLSKTNSKNNIYYILSIFAILFIFALLWYSKGYNSQFTMIDSVIESNGKVVNFKFPENFFEKTSHSTSTSYWYKTRWSGTAFIFLSSQIISPIYTFFTGNIIDSIFASQGVMVSFIFTGIGFILALYIAEIFSIKIISKTFFSILFFTQAMQIAIYTIAPSNNALNYFMGLTNGGSPIANYNGVILILLITLFPYWRYFINNKWDDWYNKKGLVALYNLLIILTALSSPAISVLYGLVSGLIFISILTKEKAIPAINHKIASTLYASIFWTTLVIVAESKIIIRANNIEFIDKLKGLQTSLIIIAVYTLVFFLLTLIPIFIIKKYQQVKTDKQIKKIMISIVLCFITMLCHLLLASTKNTQVLQQLVKSGYGSAFNSAYISPANTFFLLAITISFVSIFLYLKLSFLKGFMLMFLISHCVFYIGRHCGAEANVSARKFFTVLYEANKNKDINSNIIYLDAEVYDRNLIDYAAPDFHIRISEYFARQFNIIDKDAVIMKKEIVNDNIYFGDKE